jgi:hypothetical protein
MGRFDIEIYDTREDAVAVVRGVPAETVEEACRKVAEKKGYRVVGPSPAGLYVIDLEQYRWKYQWWQQQYRWWHQLSGAELEQLLAQDVAQVVEDGYGEFRGLYELYEQDEEEDKEEDWDEGGEE